MSTDGRKKLGAWGETVAATHLEAHDYTLVVRNWRCATGEIDLVMQKGTLLAFVEVKTRRGHASGSAEQAITPRKAQKMIDVAYAYLLAHDLDEVDFSIDVVAVEIDPRTSKLVRVDHYPDALATW